MKTDTPRTDEVAWLDPDLVEAWNIADEVLQSLTTNVKVHTPLPAGASAETEVKP